MISFVGVTKKYKDTVALNNVSLKINSGDFVFIVGSSGAGKSTLIKLLLKEIEPTEGKIYFDDLDITELGYRKVPFIRRKIGVVFQDFRLLEEKTVYENVAYAMEILGAKGRDIRRNVPMYLSMVGLSEKANNYPKELSGGEMQRVSIARALINNPGILLADEPTGNLDPAISSEIMELLEDINARGTTIIMATHDSNIVNRMQKRVIELHGGQIVRDQIRGGYNDL